MPIKCQQGTQYPMCLFFGGGFSAAAPSQQAACGPPPVGTSLGHVSGSMAETQRDFTSLWNLCFKQVQQKLSNPTLNLPPAPRREGNGVCNERPVVRERAQVSAGPLPSERSGSRLPSQPSPGEVARTLLFFFFLIWKLKEIISEIKGNNTYLGEYEALLYAQYYCYPHRCYKES